MEARLLGGVTSTADYVGATCTSARIALHASAIPHQPGNAELAAQLALEVIHRRRAGFVQVTLRASPAAKTVLGSAVLWWSRRSPRRAVGPEEGDRCEVAPIRSSRRRFLVHLDTRR